MVFDDIYDLGDQRKSFERVKEEQRLSKDQWQQKAELEVLSALEELKAHVPTIKFPSGRTAIKCSVIIGDTRLNLTKTVWINIPHYFPEDLLCFSDSSDEELEQPISKPE